MNNKEKLRHAFLAGLALPPGTSVDALTYQGLPEWDSVAHMSLIMEIENAFDLMLATEDVLDLSSFDKAGEIVARHGILLDV